MDSEIALVVRHYAKNGRWPHLTISIYPNIEAKPGIVQHLEETEVDGVTHGKWVIDELNTKGGIKISCSQKDIEEGWWGEASIPAELIPDVIEMLIEPTDKYDK